jgi:hypothetical protein
MFPGQFAIVQPLPCVSQENAWQRLCHAFSFLCHVPRGHGKSAVSRSEWHFLLSQLYPCLDVAGLDLSGPITHDEIVVALWQDFWPVLKPKVKQLFDEFFASTINLDGLNRVHLVLLPKREGVRQIDYFKITM